MPCRLSEGILYGSPVEALKRSVKIGEGRQGLNNNGSHYGKEIRQLERVSPADSPQMSCARSHL